MQLHASLFGFPRRKIKKMLNKLDVDEVNLVCPTVILYCKKIQKLLISFNITIGRKSDT